MHSYNIYVKQNACIIMLIATWKYITAFYL